MWSREHVLSYMVVDITKFEVKGNVGTALITERMGIQCDGSFERHVKIIIFSTFC